MKSIYKRMTKYINQTMLYRSKPYNTIVRADFYHHPFTQEFELKHGVSHAVTDYNDTIRSVSERLKEDNEWYMIWTNGLKDMEYWK